MYFDLRHNRESDVIVTFARLKIASPSIWDVGANQGEWSQIFFREVPGGQVFAVEATHDIAAHLQNKIAFEPRITVIGEALSSCSSTAQILWSSSQDTTIYLTRRIEERFYQYGATWLEIKSAAGDNILQRPYVSPPNSLKTNVEGYKVDILKDITKPIFSSDRPALIPFEYGSIYKPTHRAIIDVYDNLRQNYFIGRIYQTGVEFSNYFYDMDDFRMPNCAADSRDLDSTHFARSP